MFICKDLSADMIAELLDDGWDTKQNQQVECRVCYSSMTFRYHIEKQMLTLLLYYRRWIKCKNVWKPLDQDFGINPQEQLQITVKRNDNILAMVEVEEDWCLNHIRSELDMLQFDLPQYYQFRLNGVKVHYAI